MNEKTILTRSEQATFEIVAGEAIIIDLNSGVYFSLNEVGTEFWEMLDGAQSIGDHAAVIAAKYGVEKVMVATDLLEIAEKMGADKLVEQG